ncbi:MAG: BPL-N domain-containing protein [Chlamydiota bacterium]|nr:BPL-N domain-containing protein [Chlamydiota bacterium]
MRKKKIVVYSDEGVGPIGLRHLMHSLKNEPRLENFEIKRSKKDLFNTDSWIDDTALLIFPGGRDVFYQKALKGLANQRIYDYVSAGGKYLGICAGGYYGANSITFEKGYPLEVVDTRELRFFPGEARGSVYGGGLFRYGSESGSRAANLKWVHRDEDKGSEFTVYFNGGCAFVDAGKYTNVQTLAKYEDIAERPAAIVKCSVGNGTAILCGVHPEYSPKFLDHNDPYLHIVHKKLDQGDVKRQHLFGKLLFYLLEN